MLLTYFSGTVDTDDHIRLGGYPGAFRDLLGIRVEEFAPLLPTQTTTLRTPASSAVPGLDRATCTVWSEWLQALDGTDILATFADGPAAGDPAVTRRRTGSRGSAADGGGATGQGGAWYCATRLEPDAADALLAAVVAAAGVEPVIPGLPAGVDAVRRRSDSGSWLFLLDHGGSGARVPVVGTDLVTGQESTEDRPLVLAPGGVAVVREAGSS